jgi:phage/plasmid-like protein (TIGR03299 family)
MTHHVDTMMYTGQTPWHGLGVDMGNIPLSALEAIKASGLADWTVEKRPLQYIGPDFKPVVAGNGRALVRVNKPGTEAFKVHGPEIWFANRTDGYTIVQNTEAFDWIDQYDLKVETAGSLLDGRKVWILCPINGEFAPTPGDTHKAYLLVSNGHDGKGALVVKLVMMRVVCFNTLSWSLKENGKELRVGHRRNVLTKMDEFGKTIGLIEKKVSDYAELSTMLAGKRMTKGAWEEFALQVVPDPVANADGTPKSNTKAENKRDKLFDLFENGRGNQGLSAFDALNAVTEFTNYHSVPTQNQSKRLDSAWFGRGSDMNQQAVQVLTHMYA